MIIELAIGEVAELHKTLAADRRKGGFQSYMVELQERLNQALEIDLQLSDIQKINRYANYTSGGYQTRLKKIFGRTLGAHLTGLSRR